MKQSIIKELADKEGVTVTTLLRKLFKEHGSQAKVAKAIGVHPTTISIWLARCGLETRTVLVKVRETNRENC
jgi:hypothetical protein